MEINFLNTSLKGATRIAYVDQKDYTFLTCPICKRGDESYLLGIVRCGNLTSLESAYCKSCEHRYLRKLPSVEWLQDYYTSTWDARPFASGSRFMGSVKNLFRKIPFATSAWRLTRRHLLEFRNKELSIFNEDVRGKLRTIFPLLIGITEGDGALFKAQPDITKVLEVGCGDGSVLEAFYKKGFRVFGTEASPQRAQISQQKGLDIFICPVDDFKPIKHLGTFDLVYSVHVLEHVLDPASHIKHLTSIIRDGGYLYVQVPHFMNEVNFIHQCHTPVHCHSFSPRSLSLLLDLHGFTPIRMQIDGNIHIVARKAPQNGSPFPCLRVHRETADPSQLLEVFHSLSRMQGTPLKMVWNHPYFQIMRVQDGQEIYTRKVHINIAENLYHSMEFSFYFTDNRPSFPVLFNHPGDKPPVWIKVN